MRTVSEVMMPCCSVITVTQLNITSFTMTVFIVGLHCSWSHHLSTHCTLLLMSSGCNNLRTTWFPSCGWRRYYTKCLTDAVTLSKSHIKSSTVEEWLWLFNHLCLCVLGSLQERVDRRFPPQQPGPLFGICTRPSLMPNLLWRKMWRDTVHQTALHHHADIRTRYICKNITWNYCC